MWVLTEISLCSFFPNPLVFKASTSFAGKREIQLSHMSSKWLQEKTWKCINMTAVLHNSFYASCRDHAWQRELFPLKKSTVVGFSFLSGLPFNCFCFDFSSQKMMKETEISENYYLNCIQNLSIPCKYMGHLYTCGVFKLNPLQIKKKKKRTGLNFKTFLWGR